MAVFVHVKRGGNAPSPFLLLLMDVTQNKTKRNETKRYDTERNRRENDHAMKDKMETPPLHHQNQQN